MTIEEILIGQARLQGKRQGEKLGRKVGMKEGIKEGIKEAKENEIARMIKKQGLSDAEIMDFAETSLNLVKKVRKRLEQIN